jgi:hypothetical protein
VGKTFEANGLRSDDIIESVPSPLLSSQLAIAQT